MSVNQILNFDFSRALHQVKCRKFQVAMRIADWILMKYFKMEFE